MWAWWSSKAKLCTALEPQANSGCTRFKITWFLEVNWLTAGPTSNRQFGQMEGWKEGNKQMEGWKEGRKADGRMEGRMEGWKDARIEGKTEGWKSGSTSSQPCAPKGPADFQLYFQLIFN